MLWQPFHRCFAGVRRTWDPRASIVNVFTTFLLLSLSKIVFVSYYSLQYEKIRMLNYTAYTHDALYYNPNIRVDSHKHLPLVVLSYTFATIFAFIPTILLCCYPMKFFREALFFCCGRRQHAIGMFMDTFQGYYKDGINGTYDWRFLAGLYPLLRVAIIWSGKYTYFYDDDDDRHDQLVYCIIVSSVISIVRPYKKLIHNLVEIVLLNMTTALVWCVTESQSIQRVAYYKDDPIHIITVVLLLLVPHIILTLMIACKVIQLLLHHLELTYNCRFINKFPWLCAAWRWVTTAVIGDKEQDLTTTGHSIMIYGTM